MAKPKSSRWLPGLRALLSIGAELRKLRLSVDRLADAYEGKQPLVDLPAPPEDPLEIVYTRDSDYTRQFQIELRLKRQLGRDPSPDEIIRELDQEEQDPQDAPRVSPPGTRQPEREVH